jgi:hypothetical protein
MRLSIIVVIILVLLSVFCLYAVVYAQSLQVQRQSTVTVASYSIRGDYDYNATLLPNLLYNTTVLEMRNGSLFTSITKSIDVSFTCTFSLSRPGALTLSSTYLVTLSTRAWNKTLEDSTETTQRSDIDSAVVSKSFQLNVTQILALTKEIETELQYTSPSYLLQIKPLATGSLLLAGTTVPVRFEAPLNLTISAGVISTSGATYSKRGNVTSSFSTTDNGVVRLRDVSYASLAGSLGLLAVCTFYALRLGKPGRKEADELETKTRPYSEVIAEVQNPQKGKRQVTMKTWEDLVRVSDTLGKPILKFDQEEAGIVHRVFCVLDGETSYHYELALYEK